MTEPVDVPSPALNVLVAYPYLQAGMIEALAGCGPHLRFLLDCGAFTAWAGGKPVDLDAYCKSIETMSVRPWRYFALDVIGDPEATRRNYEVMLSRGLTPVPILTPGESLDVMDEYWRTSDVVGVGGLNGLGHRKHGYVKAVMRHAAGRRVHLLGYTGLSYIKAHRPYMCDASSWESGARYGSFLLYMGHGRTRQLKKTEFADRPSTEVLERIRALGMDPYTLARNAGWAGGYSINRRLAARSWVAMSLDAERALGTRLFLALNTKNALRVVREAFEFLVPHREAA